MTEALDTITNEDAKAVLARVVEHVEKAAVETEKIRLQNDRERREQQQLAEVTFGPLGLQAVNLAAMWRLSMMYARSDIVPEHYRGKPENCLIALQMAQRCKVDPFSFMQASYVVHGRPGIEGKLAIAMLNASGLIKGRMRYRFKGEGDKRSCTAIVTDKESEEQIEMELTWATVVAEGWNAKKGSQVSKWMTIPDQMFRYRSAIFLIRAYYPEVLMGLRTVDEIEDTVEEEPQHPQLPAIADGRSRTEQLADKLGGAADAGPDEDVPTDDGDDGPDEAAKGDAWEGDLFNKKDAATSET